MWVQSQRAKGFGEVNLVVQNALRNTRFQISEGRLAAEAGYNYSIKTFWYAAAR